MYRGQSAFHFDSEGNERLIPNDDLNFEPCNRCANSWINHLYETETICCRWNTSPNFGCPFEEKKIELKQPSAIQLTLDLEW